MRKIICLLFLFLLTIQAFAHEGEEHETPAKPSVQRPKILETTKTVTRTATGQKETYNLAFTIKPAQPLVNLETEIQIKITKPLPKPDPLLGSEAPVGEATIVGKFLAKGYTSSPLTAHHEEETGVYGLDFKFNKPSRYELELNVKTPDDAFSTSFPLQVNPLPGTGLAHKADLIVIVLGIIFIVGMAFSQMRKGQTTANVLLPIVGILFVGLVIVWILHGFVARRLNAPYEALTGTTSLPTLESQTPDVVQVSIDMQKLLGIKITQVKLSAVHSYLDVPGKVTPPSQGVHEIHSPVVGRIEATSHVPSLGQHVHKGQILAVVQQTLTAPEELQVQVQNLELQNKFVEVRTRLAQNRSRLSLKAKELERAKKLYEIQALALKDLQLAQSEYQNARLEVEEAQHQLALYENLQATKKIGPQLRRFPIVSPISGVVTTMDLTQGELVNPEKRLFTLMDLSTVWVQGQIYEKDLAKVHVGDSANITVAAFPNQVFQGKVKIFGSVVDSQSRTVQAIIEIANPQAELRDGMLAMVHLKAPSRTVTSIPVSAVIEEEGKSFVFVQETPTTFRQRPVTLGERVGDVVEIIQGLSSGDQVVVEGSYSLAAQARKQMKVGPHAQ